MFDLDNPLLVVLLDKDENGETKPSAGICLYPNKQEDVRAYSAYIKQTVKDWESAKFYILPLEDDVDENFLVITQLLTNFTDNSKLHANAFILSGEEFIDVYQ